MVRFWVGATRALCAAATPNHGLPARRFPLPSTRPSATAALFLECTKNNSRRHTLVRAPPSRGVLLPTSYSTASTARLPAAAWLLQGFLGTSCSRVGSCFMPWNAPELDHASCWVMLPSWIILNARSCSRVGSCFMPGHAPEPGHSRSTLKFSNIPSPSTRGCSIVPRVSP